MWPGWKRVACFLEIHVLGGRLQADEDYVYLWATPRRCFLRYKLHSSESKLFGLLFTTELSASKLD